jgi:extradiol dioxygenase family protein
LDMFAGFSVEDLVSKIRQYLHCLGIAILRSQQRAVIFSFTAFQLHVMKALGYKNSLSLSFHLPLSLEENCIKRQR